MKPKPSYHPWDCRCPRCHPIMPGDLVIDWKVVATWALAVLGSIAIWTAVLLGAGQ